MLSRDNTRSRFQRDDDDFGESGLTVRSGLEWLLHTVAVLIIGFLIWQALHALHEQPVVRAEGSKVRDALANWSTRESPTKAHVVFDSVPTADLRDWVAALPGAGTQSTWEGPKLKASAVSAEAVADPKHPTRIWVAAPPNSSISVRDEAGVIDSVDTKSGGAVLTAQHVQGTVTSIVGGTSSSTVVHDSLTVKPVLILGVAGWEGKFVLAALEEYGWKGDAQFGVTKRTQGVVLQGPASPQIDTAHYSTVIALDTSADKYAGSIISFVRNGGGFIASGEGSNLPAFASIMPGTVTGAPTLSSDFSMDSVAPRRALSMMEITRLKDGAVVVESRDRKTTVAAQRYGQGRVVQVGYLDTWRWRMGGEDDPVQLHRAWWSSMVSSVAYASKTPLVVSTASVDPTPVATLVGTLGLPTHVAAAAISALNDPRLLTFLFAILMGAFFVEWASRRLRGQP